MFITPQIRASPWLMTTYDLFSLPQVRYKKASTPLVNFLIVRWYSNKDINHGPRAPHVCFNQSAFRILCDVTAHISRSDFVQVDVVQISSCSVQCYLLFASCHDCVLILLMLLYDICHYRRSMTHALVRCRPEFKIKSKIA